ncbi:MAG: SGNH/GDSL hydrolase family protein [Mycoplasmatales bacterium]
MKKYNLVFMGDSLTAGVYNDGILDYTRKSYPMFIKEEFKKNNSLKTYYNIAVPGFTAKDTVKLLNSDLTYNENLAYNIIPEQSYRKGNYRKQQTAKLLNPDLKITEILKQADIITMTIGSNDMILYLKEYKAEWTKITYQEFKEAHDTLDLFLVSVVNNFKKIINYIRKYNKEATIIFVGSYVPQKSKLINKTLSKYFKTIEKHLKKEVLKSDKNIKWIEIRELIQENKKAYLNNSFNVHLNEAGYLAVAEQVVNELHNKLLKE